ncbi:MAG: outer membrane protein assembly factor BamA [Schleiferiaceae bacterium]|jgi:outer membrane protein insertion porin family|nr:outer membrane protein assembly factor BamA [Schleiferiaceae bacterium]MDP4759616.1 outer membrane protein assembly factor BamA [Schleiferiaceae bacterium]MDP4767376.1 outer membrane protein assembly factor BamA [Schleiferiaceae bacterium]MDP4877628.1 outer membrane protein assembly factor BamA [Schleiferiaceae bacterium]MDP4959156.1 outer membrane protein assembly factor BamA [Schleiferiaceae bacterium]
MKNTLWALVLTLVSFTTTAQVVQNGDFGLIPGIDYEVAGITVSGAQDLDPNVVIMLTNIRVGDNIQFPDPKISDAIKTLWRQQLFEDITFSVVNKSGKKVYLDIRLQELPKMSKYFITGAKKSWKDDIREELDLRAGKVVNENLVVMSRNKIQSYFREKGYLNATVDITQERDTTFNNAVILGFRVKPGERVKIGEIAFVGNEAVADKVLLKAMKNTKMKGKAIFKVSKLRKKEYREDMRALVAKYNSMGYRDARVIRDTNYRVDDELINIEITVEEGRKYYFGDITFVGNTKYDTPLLRSILKINRGDIYDSQHLNERVSFDPNGNDVASIYLNNGYLFSQVVPIEKNVQNDTIDVEIRIQEGRQATIRKVSITGNERTNDHVIYREVRTRPGDLFSKAMIQRTIRELSQLGYFDQTQIGVNPVPDPQTGTVDLEYTVVEKSTSQLELQGGWGANRVVGTLGLNFNNFSAKNIGNKRAWQPLPTGDGQTINIRAQSNGLYFQSYNASFTEPWLGGKKPNSFTGTIYHNVQSNGVQASDPNRQSLLITGINFGLGQRLKWPDDYFTLYQGLEFRRFNLNNFPTGFLNYNKGISNNVNYKFTLGRNNTDVPIFPTRGSQISFAAELTPPFSLLRDDIDYKSLSSEERFKLVEYHKWKLNADWFAPITSKFVIRTHGEFGYLGSYNKDLGLPPFERFYVGGDGLANFVIDGREIIGLRGYTNNSITPGGGGALYNKYVFEMRYIIANNPSAQVFPLIFMEGGNNYDNFWDYRAFNLKRSAGAGLRIYMPMFGLMGVDVAYGFDPEPNGAAASGWQTHFIIGQQF